MKENNWSGEYIVLSFLTKSRKILVSDCQLSGELAIKRGLFTVIPQKEKPIQNINVWTSSFMVFISSMLEKLLNKSQELLKYMNMFG